MDLNDFGLIEETWNWFIGDKGALEMALIASHRFGGELSPSMLNIPEI
jgi:hypothetical protein|eukprot:CAMPEP_0168313630 /NCGR_PEP_ID=MMETSP0210-20121227/3264_1 /TAXON_ID=40633 /ORGANISM="Condylostoma magnum, Strain COL2" /LENGTH=47 /DNA_ID= /DNA_START= /DNA_END= /DNA_ORIENTATION=